MIWSLGKAKRRIAELEERLEELTRASETVRNRPYLIDIRREGRVNKFVFYKSGELHIIETIGVWNDNINGWKEMLGIDTI